MWAAYYAQYYNQAQQTPTTSANGDSTASKDVAGDENSFIQWIDYYKAYGMTKEAEDMEERLKEYRNSKVCRSSLLLVHTYLLSPNT